MGTVLRLAAVYNIAWGTFVIALPNFAFDLANLPRPNYPELWQCIGMIVGVYGVAYWLAARDVVRHWPVVLAGLLGKVLGPIGMAEALISGRLPWEAGLVCVFNDLVWWVPFGLMLVAAWRANRPTKV
jgi:hypothetical protein